MLRYLVVWCGVGGGCSLRERSRPWNSRSLGVVGKAWDFVIHLCKFAGWKVGSLGLERVQVHRRRPGG